MREFRLPRRWRLPTTWLSRRSADRPGPTRPGRSSTVARRVGLGVGSVLLAVAVAGLVGRLIAWQRTALLGLAAATPYLLVGAPLALIAFAVLRTRLGALLAAAATVWALVIAVPQFVATTAPAGPDLVTMTSNLRLGGADPAAVVAAVRRHHVAVLMLEELTASELAALHRAGLDALLPHRLVDPRDAAAGTGLWSRYPLQDPVRHTDFSFALLTARIDVPQQGAAGRPVQPVQPVQLVALHLAGPYPYSGNWVHDVDHLPALLRSLPAALPAVVGGDFNATPDTAQFRALLTGGWADAGEQAGAGWTPTYPTDHGPTPLIAIDHVLTRRAVARTVESVSIAGSDHRALVARLRLVPAS